MGDVETNKMRPEDVKKPPVQHPGGILHQRRSMPYSPLTMAAVGVVIVGTVGYLTLYAKKKPDASAGDVAKAAVGVSEPKDNPALPK